MKNEVVENRAEAWVWDSGIWADPTGKFSRPRVFAALRALEESGLVKIRGLTYIDTRTPIEEKPLPEEPEQAYTHRISKSSEVRRRRVESTAEVLRYNFLRYNEENTFNDTPARGIQLPSKEDAVRRLFFLFMPVSEKRNGVISRLLDMDPDARVVIAPPACTDAAELETLQKIDPCQRVIPFLPYRYARDVKEVYKAVQSESESLEGSFLHVISGPYPAVHSDTFRAFLSEFCLPALDCLIYISGGVERGRLIHKKAAGLLPVIVGNFLHAPTEYAANVISSVVLSTTGNFQETNFGAKFLFNSGLTIDLTDFKNSVWRGGHNRGGNRFSESGPDPSEWELNGYKHLLENIITDGEVPTLDEFLDTQKLVDALFGAFEAWQKWGPTPQIVDIVPEKPTEAETAEGA